MNSHARQQMHEEICEGYRKKEAQEWLASGQTKTTPCPTCQGRKIIIPLGYQGEPTDCPTCTVKAGLRAISPEDVTAEADRNYDLGRKHAKQELAKIPPSMNETPLSALRLISMSQPSDFADGVAWAKWCRAVACAGLMKDGDKLQRLECREDAP